jgi:hypothetical protein
MALPIATRATNAISIAPTFKASDRPDDAPSAAASITLTQPEVFSIGTDPTVFGCSVSGCITLAIISAAGAEITDAVNRCPASIPIPTYAARTPPAIVANPPTMTTLSSDSVISPTKGRITSGASVWPTNTFAAADSVSAPDVPKVFCMISANPRTMNCMIPRW